ncbi:MAG: glutamate ABC transporter substrate-binding protein [Mycobacteriaceae bacterium]
MLSLSSACGTREPKDPLLSAAGGTLTIGIKFDQPGLGLRLPNGTYRGFDVAVAQYVANYLGATKIEWVEAPSAQRENLLRNGQVDFIAATYSISAKREAIIDFAGPYYIAGQSLLVRSDETEITGPESLNGNKRLCSVTGSTSAQKVKDKYAKDVQLQEYDSYSSCVEALFNKTIDALTTDDIILAGFAAQYPGDYKVVGKPFSIENYGIGISQGHQEAKTKINDAIEKMIADGSWQRALQEALGNSGFPLPCPPQVIRATPVSPALIKDARQVPGPISGGCTR